MQYDMRLQDAKKECSTSINCVNQTNYREMIPPQETKHKQT